MPKSSKVPPEATTNGSVPNMESSKSADTEKLQEKVANLEKVVAGKYFVFKINRTLPILC